MALSVLARQHPGRQPAGTSADGWTAAVAERLLPIRLDLARHMMQDTPSWVLWDPGIVRAEPRGGTSGDPGALCRLTVGNRRLSKDMLQMLIGADDRTTIFAGGGRRWRFIEIIRLDASGSDSTTVHRRLEILLCGRLRWLRVPVRAYAERHLRRSLASLS